MSGRLPLVALWIATGYGIAAGLFWCLLQVPESSVWMLGLSAARESADTLRSCATRAR